MNKSPSSQQASKSPVNALMLATTLDIIDNVNGNFDRLREERQQNRENNTPFSPTPMLRYSKEPPISPGKSASSSTKKSPTLPDLLKYQRSPVYKNQIQQFNEEEEAAKKKQTPPPPFSPYAAMGAAGNR